MARKQTLLLTGINWFFCMLFFVGSAFSNHESPSFVHCQDSLALPLSLGPCNLVVNAGPDITVCGIENPVQLNGSISGPYDSFSWSPPDGLSDTSVLDPIYTPTPGTQTFTLTARYVDPNNLIVNGDFSSGNIGFTTDYNYAVGPMGPDFYGISNNPVVFNGGFSQCGDHTSGSGNMMVVDGTTIAGKNIWCQTVNLMPNTEYLLSFWITSVFPVAPATVRAKFNNTAIGQINAPFSLCQWDEFRGTFNSGAGGNVSICLEDINVIAYGNDFALDDIALFQVCKAMDEVKVTSVDLAIQIAEPEMLDCNNPQTNLDASLSTNGSNIFYSWSTKNGNILSGAKTPSPLVNKPGVYVLTLTYNSGGIICSRTDSVEVQAVGDIVCADALPNGFLTCKDTLVTISALPCSSNPSVEYYWTTQDGLIVSGTDQANAVVSKAGKYSLLVIDPNTGCQDTTSVTVSEKKTLPKGTLSANPPLLDCKQDSALLTVVPIGPPNSVEVLWFGSKPFSGDPDSTQIWVKQTGTYSVALTDTLSGCRDTLSIDMKADADFPVIDAGPDLVLTCKHPDSIRIASIFPDPTALKVRWYSAKDTFLSGAPQILLQEAGTYILEVVNPKNGCKVLDSLTVLSNFNPPGTKILPPATLTCSDPATSLQTTGLDSTWVVHWSGIGVPGPANPDSSVVSVNQAGLYWAQVTDTVNGCISNDTVIVLADLSPPQVKLADTLTFLCKDNSLTIVPEIQDTGVSHGFLWSTSNGKILGQPTDSLLLAGQAGQYVLLLTNLDNGCTTSDTLIIQADSEVPQIQIQPILPLTCERSSVWIQTSIKTGMGHGFTAMWNGPSNGILSDPTADSIEVKLSGAYGITVTDLVNGCQSSASATVVLDTLKPVANAGTGLELDCQTKSLSLDGSGSSQGNQYTYQWTTSNGNILSGSLSLFPLIDRAGIYVLEVRNTGNGCTAQDSVVITKDQDLPDAIILPPGKLTCTVNSLVLDGSPSGSGVTYTWSTANGHIVGSQTGSTAVVDKAGTYQLLVTDLASGCTQTAMVNVQNDQVPPTIVIKKPDTLTCLLKEALLDASASAGNSGTLSFAWTSGNGLFLGPTDQPIATALSSGSYSLFLTDQGNGCTASAVVMVWENQDVPQTDFTWNGPGCTGKTADLIIEGSSGGNAPFQYSLDGWNTVLPGQLVEDLAPGTYTLWTKNANGCESQQMFSISQPFQPSIDLPAEIFIDYGTDTLLSVFYQLPAQDSVTFSWTPQENLSCHDCPNPVVQGLDKTRTYTVVVQTKDQCRASASIRIFVDQRPDYYIPSAFSPGNQDGFNDRWRIYVRKNVVLGIREMEIYDRWGELMMHAEQVDPDDLEASWDGKFKGQLLNPGVFVYRIILELSGGREILITGDFTLVN